MDEFDVVLTDEAQIDIQRLPAIWQNRILNKLEWMGLNVPLLRYQMVVLKVGHRREIYKL